MPKKMHFSHELAYLTFFISPANLSSLNSPNTNRFTKIKHNNRSVKRINNL